MDPTPRECKPQITFPREQDAIPEFSFQLGGHCFFNRKYLADSSISISCEKDLYYNRITIVDMSGVLAEFKVCNNTSYIAPL